jgi:DnaJ-domain-containing protein 1
VSIGKRLIDLAKSELNSLLDRAAQLDDDEDAGDRAPGGDEMGEPPPRESPGAARPRPRGRPGRGVRLEDLSDEQLEAEIERRRLERELEERARRNANARTASGAYRAATGAYGPAGSPGSTGPSGSAGTGRGSRAGGARPWSAPADPVARAYAALEVPPGSNFETVRKAYRNLMRKYHPDRHTASPEKQKAANELAQKLTASYDVLEKHLRR